MSSQVLDSYPNKLIPYPYKHRLLIYKLSSLMFLVLLNTNLLRSLKDSIIPLKLGVEALSFVRIYLEIPILCLWVFIYRFWIDRASQATLFKSVVGFYFILTVLFSLYSSSDLFLTEPFHSPKSKIEISLYYWPYSLVYVLYDLWPIFTYMNFYWELSNRLFTIQEAKIAYPRYYLIGQSNLLISGAIIMASTFFDSMSVFGCILESKSLIVILACVNFIFIERLYTGLSKYVPINTDNKVFKRIAIWEVWRIPFYKLLFFSLVSYYAAICLLEIMCIYYLRARYPQLNDLMFVQGLSVLSLGILTILLSYLSRKLLLILKISTSLQILPLCLLILGVSSFILLIWNNEASHNWVLFLITFIVGRGIKYTIYDSAKEISTIPLKNEIKRMGRVVDVVGTGVGRFMGHFIPVVVFTVFPFATYDGITNIVAVLFITFSIIFYISNKKLGRCIRG